MDRDELLAMTVSGPALRSELRKRRSAYLHETVKKALVDGYREDGWDVERVNRGSTRMRKLKAVDVAFEDRVWTLLAGLAFSTLNRDRNFELPYGGGVGERRQFDVFAADDECLLLVECKATGSEDRKTSFKGEIEGLVGVRPGILSTLKKSYPDHKVKFILATSGYAVGGADRDRLAAAEIAHFAEDAVSYYEELSHHLGVAARFQLLGALLAGKKIPGMETQVPAIEGRMGGHRFYSFSIEPEKLLKIGYVLHRSKASTDLMPTYQRLIKKTRLKSVREFVTDGNFFPNSIVINIDAGKRGLRFDRAEGVVEGTKSRLGVLHLPQSYRSAYVIDGQHRLYGYAGTELAATETLPVVAFVNLGRTDQLRLFMQINENQKSVPKNLRNTLNASLLWDVDDLSLRSKALKLQLAQDLGECRHSPLYGRVVIGENRPTATCCITIDTIRIGLDRGNFCGRFTATEVVQDGSFYKGSNESTMAILVPFLYAAFSRLREGLPAQWALGNAPGGFVFINAGIESLLRVLSDVVDHLVAREKVNPKTLPTDELMEYVDYYLDPVIAYLRDLSPDESVDLRQRYGSGGRAKYWRSLQRAVHEQRPEFDPEGMGDYWVEQAQNFNREALDMVLALERFMNNDFRVRLEGKYGDRWFKVGVPDKVYAAAFALAAQKNRDRDTADEVEPWDCLVLIHYREIATYSDKQWKELFEKRYTKPGDEQKRGRDARTTWMVELNRIRNELAHPAYGVKETEYQFLRELTEWLIEGRVDNDLD